jgi:hypothetical protein
MRNRENEADRRSSISNKRRSRYKPTNGRFLSRIQMRQLRLSRRWSSQSSPSQRARRHREIYEHQRQQQRRQRKQPTILTNLLPQCHSHRRSHIKTHIHCRVIDIKVVSYPRQFIAAAEAAAAAAIPRKDSCCVSVHMC